MKPTYAAFSESEYRSRLARARAALRKAGIDCCIAVAPEDLYYLGGYDSWVASNSPQALVFMTDGGEPTLLVRNVDELLPRETSWIKDIRTYYLHQENAAERIAAIAREKGLKGGRVAIELQSFAIPYAFGKELAEALLPARLEDATVLLGDLRHIKSAGELAYLREAARYANLGLAAARKALKPGVTEIELAAALEGAMRHAGGDYWSIPTELTSGPRSPGGHGTPRERKIRPRDLVHVEFAGVSHRYHAVALHTMALGQPSARARDIYRLTRESLTAGLKAIRPGASVHDVEEASYVPLRREGLEHTAMMRFGYGIGIAFPPIWLESLQISRGFKNTLEPGMVFVLHACLELVDEGIGTMQGGTYEMTRTGLKMLVGGGDCELDVVPVRASRARSAARAGAAGKRSRRKASPRKR
ncbi:MAG: Xaa-Pro peptidase family protein [Alphaproteobacteria bacterium]